MKPLSICQTEMKLKWHLKSPASRLFTQPFVQVQIKENIKAPRHWPVTREMFPIDDVIMFLLDKTNIASS